MSAEKGDPSPKESLDAILADAKGVLEALNQIRTQADEQLKAGESIRSKNAEEAAVSKGIVEEIAKIKALAEEHLKGAENSRKKADDEASYASQAKNNTEVHAKAVASFKGQAEGEFTTITINRQKSEELLQAITVKKAASDADGNTINESRKAIEQAAQGIVQAAADGAVRLAEVNEAKDSVIVARKESETMCDAAIQARNKTEDAQKEVEQFSVRSNELTSKISEVHETSTQEAAEIARMLTTAKADKESLAEVLEHLGKSAVIATGHEERVARLSEDLKSLIEKVENLLPGATSAGLASAFNAQKNRFGSPQRRWLWAFVICMAGLVAVALPSFLHAAFGNTVSSWDELLRGLAMRLPIVIPLVWLAIYAGRNYMLSLRLEEEYAYKAAVSTAFEGYKREMEKIAAGDANNPTPLTTLCINILRAISERPGRIYEGKQEDITVLNEMKTTADKAEEFGKKTVATV